MVDLLKIAREHNVKLTIEYNTDLDNYTIKFRNEFCKGGVSIEERYLNAFPPNDISERILDELKRMIRRSEITN